MRKFVLLALIIGIFFQACKDNSLEKLRENELNLLADFVARYNEQHNADLEPTLSGLYYIQVEEGVGDSIVV
ncbi:MAG: hypothetical protein JXR31_01125, partial [Prolixibacteraceae bacterium]|nr:hypothetical protein [Prolixibacteraceae bacterium]MBN2772818.1 hypothetical protein [Prolixibacteraceae bacterium]